MKRLAAVAGLCILGGLVWGGNPGAGKLRYKVPAGMPAFQRLWTERAPGAKADGEEDIPGVRVYLPASDKANGAAVVVCPGGGYGSLAMDHEGKQIGEWLNSIGVAGIILQYRLGPKYHHPVPLTDAQRALRYTRAHAKEWKVDPHRIGILGFSAGGHLASTAATKFDEGDKSAADPLEQLSSRPDFAVLLYPVISLRGAHAHLGSGRNLIGDDPKDQKLYEALSNENNVTARTPPTFLVHTTEDTGVKPDNSIVFYQALVKSKVPAELHIYEKGQHGLGLGPKHLPFNTWPQRCAAWLEGQGMFKNSE